MTTTLQTQYAKHLTEYTTASAGSALLIDFLNNGFSQNIPLSAATCALTFTAPKEAANITLRFTQDGTGSRLVTWPGTFVGTPPTLNSSINTDTIVNLYYTGSKYYFVIATGPAGGLTSFNSRTTPAAVPTAGDYNTGLITNSSVVVAGSTATNALDYLYARDTLEYKNVTLFSASRTIALTDIANLLVCTVGTTITITIPNTSSVAFTAGQRFSVLLSVSNSLFTIVGASGVLVTLAAHTNITSDPNRVYNVDCITSNSWLVSCAPINSNEILNEYTNVPGTYVTDAISYLYNQDLREYKDYVTISSSYNFLLADEGKLGRITTSSAITLTFLSNAVSAFPIGSRFSFTQFGVVNFNITVAAGSGATVLFQGGFTSIAAQQNRIWDVTKIDTNTWLVTFAPVNSYEILDGNIGPTVYDTLSSIINSATTLTSKVTGDINLSLSNIISQNASNTAWYCDQQGWYGTATSPSISPLFGVGPISANATVTGFRVRLAPANSHTGLPATLPVLTFGINRADGTHAILATVTDPSANATSYNLVHNIVVPSGVLGQTGAGYSLFFSISDEQSTFSLPGLRLLSAILTVS